MHPSRPLSSREKRSGLAATKASLIFFAMCLGSGLHSRVATKREFGTEHYRESPGNRWLRRGRGRTQDAFTNNSFAINALYDYSPSTSFEFQASGYKADRNTYLGNVSFDVADYGDDAFYLSGKMKHELTINSHLDVGLAYNKVSEVFKFGVSGPGGYYRPELLQIDLINPDHADTTFVGGTVTDSVRANEQTLIDSYMAFLNQYGAAAFDYVNGYANENIEYSQATGTVEYEFSWNHFLMSVGGEFVDVKAESDTFLKGGPVEEPPKMTSLRESP